MKPKTVFFLLFGILSVAVFALGIFAVSQNRRTTATVEPAPTAQTETGMPLPRETKSSGSLRSGSPKPVTIIAPAERKSSEDPTLDEIQTLLASPDPRNEMLALDLLHDFDDETALPFLRLALASANPQVRATAIEFAASLHNDRERGKILEQGIIDREPFVGHTVLDQVESLPSAERSALFAMALDRAPAEIGSAVLGLLEVESTHPSVDLMIAGLESRVEATRQGAAGTLEFLFERNFANATEARQWWETHQGNYDRDLVEKF